MKKNSSIKEIRRLAMLGLLTALVIVFGYIPLKFGPIEMTLMMLPVVLGAVLQGPLFGGILGGVFGLVSFLQCFGFAGLPFSAFGNFVFGLSPLFTVILCFIPRILMGVCVGWIFRGLQKIDRTNFLSYLISNVCGALLNTLFFMGALTLMFWSNADFISKMAEWGVTTENVFAFFIAFVSINGLVEAIVCAVLGTAISKGVHNALRKSHIVA